MTFTARTWDSDSSGNNPKMSAIETGIEQAHHRPYVDVFNNVSQNSSTGVNLSLVFNSEALDDWGMHSGSDAFVTIPAGYTGVWQFDAGIRWGASSAGTYRQIQIIVGASGYAVQKDQPTAAHIHHVSLTLYIGAGTQVSVMGTQDSGGVLTVDNALYSTHLRGYFLGWQ